MTFEDSRIVPEHVLSTLRDDAKASAPPEARARVLARLGVATAAGAAAATQAGAASAALGKAAGTSAAPLAGGGIVLGLVKTLVSKPIVGAVFALSVGSGVGLGAYQTFRAEPKVGSPASAVMRSSEPSAARPRAPSTALPEVPRATEPPHEPVVPGDAPPSDRKREVPRPALAPVPDLPVSGGAARLAEQQALLDQARASLRRGDGAGAVAIVREHEARYPVTAFAEEREAIAILSLATAGRSGEARTLAEDFSKRFPTSLFLPSIWRSLGRAEPSPRAADPGE